MDTLQTSIHSLASRSLGFPLEQPTAENPGLATRLNTRRPHKKSRLGCMNCKARRVKCDEREPGCLRCMQKGIACKYNRKSSPASQAENKYTPINISTACHSLSNFTCSPNPTIATLINDNLIRRNGSSTYGLRTTNLFEVPDVLRLRHFQNSTCFTIGNSRIQQVYQAELTKLAINHMHLMHAILAMSAMHIRFLKSVHQRPAPLEIYHWRQTLLKFGQKVVLRIDNDDADAMLATATLVNGISFAMVEATDPVQSWPFSPRANDLQWLSLQGGIGLIFQATQPLHDDSVLKVLFDDLDENEAAASNKNFGLTSMPPRFLELCDITAKSTVENNPYYAALQLLAPLLQLECTAETIITHLSFIGSLPPEYVSLLRGKDHRALLILSYWYATICSFECWWTAPRSRTECIAICMYLGEYANDSVQELLLFPARACGYTLKANSSFTGDQVSQVLVPCRLM